MALCTIYRISSGNLVIIIIVSLSPATDIGLLIQARDSTETLDPNSTIWGTWIAPTEEPLRYKTLLCKRNQTTSNETLFEVIIIIISPVG